MEQKKPHDPVGKAGSMPGATGFTMACFEADKVKVGDCLYSEAQFLELCETTSALLAALEKAREDINWMLNSGQSLNGHVFDYIDGAISKAKGFTHE